MKTRQLMGTLLMGALVTLVTACGADDEVINSKVIEENKQDTIFVSMGGSADTRLQFVHGSSYSYVRWEIGDQLRLYAFDADTKCIKDAIYTLASISSTRVATFVGDAMPSDMVRCTVCYPIDAELDSEGYLARNIRNFPQQGDGLTNHLNGNLLYSHYLRAGTDPISIDEMTLYLETSIMRFDLSNVPAEVGKLQKLEWTVETKSNGTQTHTLNFATDAVTFSASKSTLVAYSPFYVFDIGDIKAGGSFTVKLIGDKTYSATISSTRDRYYSQGSEILATFSSGWTVVE